MEIYGGDLEEKRKEGMRFCVAGVFEGRRKKGFCGGGGGKQRV